MTAHCMAVNMTKVKEVGADQYIDTDKHTWSTDGFLKTVDALYNGGYENVAACLLYTSIYRLLPLCLWGRAGKCSYPRH